MRLYEVSDRFANDLSTILRNQAGRADSKHAPLVISYDALSNMLRNMGYGKINQAGLTNIMDLHPDIQALVKDYDEDHIELATLEEPPPDTETPMDVGNSTSVQTMARSANPYM